MNAEVNVASRSIFQLDFAVEPNIESFPLSSHNGAGRHPRAKAPFAFHPLARIKFRLLPARVRLVERVAPLLSNFLRSVDEDSFHRRRTEQRLVPLRGLLRIELEHLAVVGQ